MGKQVNDRRSLDEDDDEKDDDDDDKEVPDRIVEDEEEEESQGAGAWLRPFRRKASGGGSVSQRVDLL